MNLKKKNVSCFRNYINFGLSMLAATLFAILYFMFRGSNAFVSLSFLGDAKLAGICVGVCGIAYAVLQILGVLVSSFRFNIVMFVLSIIVSLGSILPFFLKDPKNQYMLFLLFRLFYSLGFVFATTAIMVNISDFIRKNNLSQKLFSILSPIFVFIAAGSGLYIGKNFEKFFHFPLFIFGRYYGINDAAHLILIITAIVSILCGVIMLFTVPRGNQGNQEKKTGFFKSMIGAFSLIFKDKMLFFMMIFSIIASCAYYILLELPYYQDIIFTLLGYNGNNVVNHANSLIVYGFSIGCLFLGFLQMILRGPINLLVLVYFSLTGIFVYIEKTRGHTPPVLLYIFSFFLGLTSAAQFCIFDIVERKFKAHGYSTTAAISIFNFFYMFSAALAQIIIAYFFNAHAMFCFRICFIATAIASFILLIALISHYMQKNKK